MSATSSSFWSATEAIREDLNDIASMGVDMYGNLEASDDPGAVADALCTIQARIGAVQTRIANTIPAMQDIAKAFDAMASVKS